LFNRKRRGFTVIEVLVFSVILLLLMGSIVLVVQGGMRYMRKGAAYQDAQKQTLVCMKKIIEDLSVSTPSRIEPPSPLADSNHIIFLSPVPDPLGDWSYDGSSVEYQAWICYYREAASNTLIRIRRPLAGPSTSNELDDPPVLADFTSPEGGDIRTVVGRGVTDFRVNDGPTSQMLSITLASSVETGTNKNTTVVSRSMATMPNP
jgi:Prokaryotic N-terminal methylation motif